MILQPDSILKLSFTIACKFLRTHWLVKIVYSALVILKLRRPEFSYANDLVLMILQYSIFAD